MDDKEDMRVPATDVDGADAPKAVVTKTTEKPAPRAFLVPEDVSIQAVEALQEKLTDALNGHEADVIAVAIYSLLDQFPILSIKVGEITFKNAMEKMAAMAGPEHDPSTCQEDFCKSKRGQA